MCKKKPSDEICDRKLLKVKAGGNQKRKKCDFRGNF